MDYYMITTKSFDYEFAKKFVSWYDFNQYYERVCDSFSMYVFVNGKKIILPRPDDIKDQTAKYTFEFSCGGNKKDVIYNVSKILKDAKILEEAFIPFLERQPTPGNNEEEYW